MKRHIKLVASLQNELNIYISCYTKLASDITNYVLVISHAHVKQIIMLFIISSHKSQSSAPRHAHVGYRYKTIIFHIALHIDHLVHKRRDPSARKQLELSTLHWPFDIKSKNMASFGRRTLSRISKRLQTRILYIVFVVEIMKIWYFSMFA